MRCATARVLPVPAPASTQTGPRLARATSRCSGSSAASTASDPVSARPSGVSTGVPPCRAIFAHGTDAGGNPAADGRVTNAQTPPVAREMTANVAAADYVHHHVVRVLQTAEEPAREGRHRDG